MGDVTSVPDVKQLELQQHHQHPEQHHQHTEQQHQAQTEVRHHQHTAVERYQQQQSHTGAKHPHQQLQHTTAKHHYQQQFSEVKHTLQQHHQHSEVRHVHHQHQPHTEMKHQHQPQPPKRTTDLDTMRLLLGRLYAEYAMWQVNHPHMLRALELWSNCHDNRKYHYLALAYKDLKMEKASHECRRRALHHLHWFCEKNDSLALTLQAYCHQNGEGVPKDMMKAIGFYMRAAAQGNAVAQYQLGVIFERGQGVPHDLTTAISYWEAGTAQNQPACCNCMAVAYETGEGKQRDMKTALSWYSKSADNGSRVALFNLGLCFKLGQGMPTNLLAALQWLTCSADRGYADAVRIIQDTCKALAQREDKQYASYSALPQILLLWYTPSSSSKRNENTNKAAEAYYSLVAECTRKKQNPPLVPRDLAEAGQRLSTLQTTPFFDAMSCLDMTSSSQSRLSRMPDELLAILPQYLGVACSKSLCFDPSNISQFIQRTVRGQEASNFFPSEHPVVRNSEDHDFVMT